jgi:hypothetical protein
LKASRVEEDDIQGEILDVVEDYNLLMFFEQMSQSDLKDPDILVSPCPSLLLPGSRAQPEKK